MENFSAVKRIDGVEEPKWTDSPYGPEELRKKLSVVPVKDIRNLGISFPIPDLADEYKASVSSPAFI